MRFSINIHHLLLHKACVFHIPPPSKGKGRGEGIGMSIKTLGRALIIVSAFFGSAVFAQSAEGPQELPKPILKSTPPLFQEWTFNNDQVNSVPAGFSSDTVGEGAIGTWQVQADDSAPSRPQTLVLKPGCERESCYHLILVDGTNVEYLDLSVRVKMVLGSSTGKGGLVFAAKDPRNFYAVVVTPETNTLEGFLVQDGVPTLLGKGTVEPAEREWHFLRIHRSTMISHDLIEVFFDKQLILSLSDSTFHAGQVGLVAFGQGAFGFDNLRAMELLSQRPLSRPPAY